MTALVDRAATVSRAATTEHHAEFITARSAPVVVDPLFIRSGGGLQGHHVIGRHRLERRSDRRVSLELAEVLDPDDRQVNGERPDVAESVLGRSDRSEQLATREHLHCDDPDPQMICEGQKPILERVPMHVSRIHGEQDRVEPMPGQRMQQHLRIRMTTDPDVPHEALCPRLLGHLDRTTRPEHFVDLRMLVQVMDLEQIDVIGAKAPKRVLELPPRRVSIALVGLGRQEHPITRVRRDFPVVQLGVLVKRRSIEVVHAELKRAPDDAHGSVRMLVERRFTAKAQDRSLKAGRAEGSVLHGPMLARKEMNAQET